MTNEKISNLCDINIGKTPSRNNNDYWGEGFNWLSISDMKSKYVNSSKEQITDIAVKSCNMRLIPVETVLMSFKLSIGKVAITQTEMYTNEAIASFKIKNPDLLHVGYLYYALQMIDLLKDTDRAVKGATLNKAKLNELEIPLPPLDMQKKITYVLDKAQELIDNRKKQIELLDEFLQSVFIDMFGDIFSNSLGWNSVKMMKLVKTKNDLVDGPFGSSINTKIDYVNDGEIPVIRTKNVANFRFITQDLRFMYREKYETVKRSQVLPGDIILTKVGTIGNICIFPDLYPEAVLSTTGSCRIRVNEDVINKIYFVYYLHIFRPKMLQIASTGVQAFLNMEHIKKFDILLPPIQAQNKFAAIAETTEKQRTLIEQNLAEMENNFNSIMQRAFRGELFN